MKALSFDAYTLKWIAVIGMITNHVAIAFASVLPFVPMLILYALGGLTYVIMAYFVVEGYKHTSNLKKYIGRLFIFGLIAQAFHPTVLGSTDIIGTGFFLNIMFTIILSLFVLLMYDKIKIRILFWLLFVVACIVAMFMDLFFVGVLVPLLYYTIKKESRRRTLPGIVAGIIFAAFGLLSAITPILYLTTGAFAAEIHAMAEMTGMTIELMIATPFFAIGCFLAAILIRNYNGDRGKRAKWLFYVAYPMHLAIIAVAAVLMGITTFNLFGFIPL
ncbi:MAG: conjugal transfer protein TraX [Defluviitaleaceae bacterium]|nr:conjugal transfer protein TraX [Defluviitaleaceae bacterium]